MTIVPVMWTVWTALAVIAAALYLYRSTLQRDEEDQIFLDDSFSHERAAQEIIIAKVNKIEPAVRVMKWLVGAATVFVMGYYIMDIVKQF